MCEDEGVSEDEDVRMSVSMRMEGEGVGMYVCGVRMSD